MSEFEDKIFDSIRASVISELPAGIAGDIVVEAFNIAMPAIKTLIDDNVKSISAVRLSAPKIVIEVIPEDKNAAKT